MQTADVNGVELEYEVTGSGEPVLFIGPVLADGFLPLVRQPEIADRYQSIHYHKRGWVGSTHTSGTVGIEEHAADAAALLGHLDVPRAHVAGHSSGAAVAVQLALDEPQMVHTLALLELSLFALPNGQGFLRSAGPVFDAYERGDHADALAMFMTAVSGLDWTTCRALLDDRVPGATAQALKDADTCFGVELPALTRWSFDAQRAATIRAPLLSVRGSNTQPMWVEIAEFLRSSVPDVEDCTVEGVGHLLHIERPEPVAHALAEFLDRHAMTQD
jgi:pimeloyl-ACP methyl ester carboxylesterase